jgi:hypothetical protein
MPKKQDAEIPMDLLEVLEALEIKKDADYESAWKEAILDEEYERLQAKKTRPHAGDEMAQRIMDALCENGHGDFLLIRDDEIREWWQGVVKERAAEQRRADARRRRAELRENALKKLTEEERRALGIKG